MPSNRFLKGYNGTPEERFWKKVDKDGPTMKDMDTNCWVWVGGTGGKKGGEKYPQINIEGKVVKSVRYSYQMAYGEIPKGGKVFHYCTNNYCVRPEHLFVSFDGAHAAKHNPIIVIDGQNFKRCSTCDELLPYNSDNYHETGRGTLRSYCKRCSYKTNRNQRLKNWDYILWVHAKDTAEIKGLEFSLTREDIKEICESQKGLCYWFGVPLVSSIKPRYPLQHSLDRLDLHKGYTRGNVVLCCYVANIGRNHNTVDEFSKFIEVLKVSLCQNFE